MFSICVDLWAGVPFRWRNLDTLPEIFQLSFRFYGIFPHAFSFTLISQKSDLPKTVDVRLAAVLISMDLLRLLTGLGLRKIFSSVFLTRSGTGDALFRSSDEFGDSLRCFVESLRLLKRIFTNQLYRSLIFIGNYNIGNGDWGGFSSLQLSERDS